MLTLISSPSFAVMMKKLIKERKEKEEHFHEKEKEEHHGPVDPEEKVKKEDHFDPKELLDKLQKIWKVLNMACSK